jgi:ankyrin repeat protein
MHKRLLLSPIFILIFLLAGYEFYTSIKGRELLTAAHIVEGLSSATPIKVQVAEYYYMHGDFPVSNDELGLPPPESFAGRSVKSIEVSLGGKITIVYNNALKKDSSIVLTPSTTGGYSTGNLNWACATETIEQSYLDSLSLPCYYVPPGALSKLMDSILVANEVEARAAILAGANVNGTLNGDSPLLSAITRDRLAIARQLVEAGADVNQQALAHQKITPLIHAASLGKEKFVDFLLDNHARIDGVDAAGKTALMHAAEKGQDRIVELLLSRGANPLLKDGRGRDAARYVKSRGRRKGIHKLIDAAKQSYTALAARRGDAEGVSELMWAASDGDEKKVRRLLSGESSINALDSFNANALHYAVEVKQDAIAGMLIRSGIDVNAADRDGTTPLMLAIKNGSTEMVADLLQASANVNVLDRYQYSPFLMAVRYGYTDIVTALLKAGAQETLNKALHETFASPASKNELVKIQGLILDAGFKLERDEKDLELLLLKAVQESHAPVAQFLLQHDVNVDADVEGVPLHVAAQNGDLQMAQLLVEQGANINAVTEQGKTALMFAVESGNIRLVKHLLDSGAKVETTDVNGLTALRMAKANFAENIVELLRRYKK